jgi:hypothetical protein
MSKYKDSFKKPKATNDNIKQRKCLLCSKMFMSFGPGNRICALCKKKPEYRHGSLSYYKCLF